MSFLPGDMLGCKAGTTRREREIRRLCGEGKRDRESLSARPGSRGHRGPIIAAMNVLDPIPASETGPITPLARRSRDLRGLRIGVLDNSKPNADMLLGRVAERLAQHVGASPLRTGAKPRTSVPA